MTKKLANTENIEQMRKRHEKERNLLQKLCPHKKTGDWVTEYWAIAHSTGFQVKICKFCGAKVARRTTCRKCGELTEDPQNGDGTHSRPGRAHYCPRCIKRTPEEIAEDDRLEKSFKESVKPWSQTFKKSE